MRLQICSAAVLPLIWLPVWAAETAAGQPGFFYGNVQLMSDYISAGLSQSVGKPALQIEFDANPGDGIYASFVAVNVNWIKQLYPGANAGIELDGVLGYRESFAQDGVVKAGILQVQYPGRYARQSPPAERPDTTILFGSVAWNVLSAKLNYAVTDAFGTPGSRGAWYLDTNAVFAPTERWSTGLHVGRRHSHGTNPLTGADNAKRYSYYDYRVFATRWFGAAASLTLSFNWSTTNPAIYTLNGFDFGGSQAALTFEQDF